MSMLPLEGLVVLEFCQYLSGPSAGLRLADLGARVIKVERPKGGDACRKLSIKNLWTDENSLLFHTINRNKESFTADLKNPEDVALLKKLIAKADVLTHNFRPGVMEATGLSYTEAKSINPAIIYASITGYGNSGPWKKKPGQDLLLQSMSGLTYTTGNNVNGPVPFGLSISDILCGAQLVQGILAALIRRQKTNMGALVEISLMESLLDFQFELLTTYYNSGTLPRRSNISNGNPLLSAPYGIYATADSYIAIAMSDLSTLARALYCKALTRYTAEHAFADRDEIKKIITDHVLQHASAFWLKKLHEHKLWAMEVFDWHDMTGHEAYQVLEMEQEISTGKGDKFTTTRCPIRINGQRIFSKNPAPQLGEHTKKIYNEFLK